MYPNVCSFFCRENHLRLIPHHRSIHSSLPIHSQLSITPAHMQIQASWIDKAASSLAICDFQLTYTNQVDMSLHEGNKPVGTNGLKRMREFCNFVFSDSVKENYIIVGCVVYIYIYIYIYIYMCVCVCVCVCVRCILAVYSFVSVPCYSC